MSDQHDPFGAIQTLDTPLGTRRIASLQALAVAEGVSLHTVPYGIRVLLESCLRHCDGHTVDESNVRALLHYDATAVAESEIPFKPGRVVLQDFTGVPAMVDLAAMRTAVVEMTGKV